MLERSSTARSAGRSFCPATSGSGAPGTSAAGAVYCANVPICSNPLRSNKRCATTLSACVASRATVAPAFSPLASRIHLNARQSPARVPPGPRASLPASTRPAPACANAPIPPGGHPAPPPVAYPQHRSTTDPRHQQYNHPIPRSGRKKQGPPLYLLAEPGESSMQTCTLLDDYLLAASQHIGQETGLRPSPRRHTSPAQPLAAILSHQASRALDPLTIAPEAAPGEPHRRKESICCRAASSPGGNCLHSKRSLIAPGYDQTPQRHQTSGAVVLGDARR